jgi:hypothetical protein
MTQTIPQPLNEMQLEILQLFNRDVSEEDMLAIKRFIVRYFAQKAISGANQKWDENGWTAEDEERLLNLHERTPYLHH